MPSQGRHYFSKPTWTEPQRLLYFWFWFMSALSYYFNIIPHEHSFLLQSILISFSVLIKSIMSKKGNLFKSIINFVPSYFRPLLGTVSFLDSNGFQTICTWKYCIGHWGVLLQAARPTIHWEDAHPPHTCKLNTGFSGHYA